MTIRYHLNQPADVVFDCLTDMQKFADLHPVIYRIESKGQDNFLVFERLRMLFIPVSFTYPVKVESDKASGKIKMDSTVKRMARIEIHFSIRQENGKTTVDETLIFSSKLPIKRTFHRLFKKQHDKLFRNIDRVS